MSEMNEELEKMREKKLERILRESKEEAGGQTSVRIVIPVGEETGFNARLSEHFGRAPNFAVVELDKEGRVTSQRMVPNVSEHFGGAGRPPDRILQLEPDAVITYGMGPRGLRRFQEARVAVLRANASTVREVIAAYIKNDLQELTEGCHHARHQ